MIAIGFRLEAAIAARPGRSIRRYPAAKLSFRADETPVRRLRVVPAIMPLSVDKKSHRLPPEAIVLIIAEGLQYFLFRIHDERAATRDRLIQTPAGYQQEAYTFTVGGYPKVIALA